MKIGKKGSNLSANRGLPEENDPIITAKKTEKRFLAVIHYYQNRENRILGSNRRSSRLLQGRAETGDRPLIHKSASPRSRRNGGQAPGSDPPTSGPNSGPPSSFRAKAKPAGWAVKWPRISRCRNSNRNSLSNLSKFVEDRTINRFASP